MLTPSAEQIRTLAPDASAARAGEGLADRRRWSDAGRTETAAWGLCQGSGASPYQVAVDLAGPAYRCSCPSRKIPCKHALGLLFLVADGGVDAGQPPAWVAEWLEARATRAAAAAERPERSGPVDEAARAKRVESRERKVAAGIEELDRWLADLVRRGLDGARAEGYRFWDSMGARLVDAQAGGLGRSVRGLGSAASAGEAWPHVLLEGAARLHLLTEAYRRADALPDGLRADVRALVGWTTKEDDLDASDAVEDRWLVLGRRLDDTGQIITARTFLLGETSGRMALHLAFGVGAAPPTLLAAPGQAFRATLAFYPSATPLRAAVRPMLEPDGEVTALPWGASITEVAGRHAERLAANPFLDAWPVVLGAVTPLRRGERLVLREADGTAVPALPASVAARLLAVSGGRPVAVAGEWDGDALRPIGVFAEGRLVGLDAPDTPPPRSRDGDPAWAALVSAALVGTERSGDSVSIPPVASPLVDVADRERALLAAAGVLTVRRRAGARPATDDAARPSPAPDDERPALTGAPARLVGLVAGEHRALLPEVLDLMRRSGRRVPSETLPELLEATASDPALRAEVTALGGPRATWLVAAVPELAAPDDATAVTPDDDAAWDGIRGARAREARVRALRAADPDGTRDALEARFGDLPGEERAAAVEALAVNLSSDDEPFLARALTERRLDVRRAAAGLLVRLDGTSLARLVEERARPLLRIEGRLRPALHVELPALDPELDAAGFGGTAPQGMGERAWLLRQLLAHVRPSLWSQWLDTEPPKLVELALRTDEARPLLEGWLEAAARSADAGWVEALLREPKVAATVSVDPALAVLDLPPAARPAVVVAARDSVDLPTLARLVDACPAPWPRSLVDAVLVALAPLAGEPFPDQALYALVRAAAVGAPPDRADELAVVASYAGSLRPALGPALETLRLRARIHSAFDTLPPIEP